MSIIIKKSQKKTFHEVVLMHSSFHLNIIFNFNITITVLNFVYNNSDGKDIPYNRHDSVQC